MKVRDVMTSHVIRINPEESVSVAARTLAHYNVGILPVCTQNGQVCGLVTDRDIVTRCLAANQSPENTTVRQVMTGRVLSVEPDMDTGTAASLMGREQVRRLPVLDNGKLCGMVTLGDLARRDACANDAAGALTEITSNISSR